MNVCTALRLTESEALPTAAFELEVYSAAAAVLDDDEYLLIRR